MLDFIHPTVKPEDLQQFFWQHLIRDLELLSKVIGYSVDDAALIVHLILQGVHNSTCTGEIISYIHTLLVIVVVIEYLYYRVKL